MKTQLVKMCGMQEKQAVLRGKFITLNAYIRKEERSRYSHLTLYHRKLETKEQIKSQVSKRNDKN